MSEEVIILIPFVLILGLFIHRFVSNELWKNGLVPRTFRFSEHNLFQVFIALAIVMIKAEKRDTFTKKRHLVGYVRKQFPESMSDFRFYYRYFFRGPSVKVKSACNWVNRHISDDGYKSQILYFLTGIAFVDGRLHGREEKILYAMCKYLQLHPSVLYSIISSYKEAFERQYQEEEKQRKKREEKRTRGSTDYKKKRMAAILEVDISASFDEIKKAYRRLVKLHHPDRFQNNGPEQIKMARERFIEIQLAYEFFEKLND